MNYLKYAERFRDRYTEEQISRAVNRLDHGDLSATRYGMRAATRPDLGDRRVTGAYFPELCKHRKAWLRIPGNNSCCCGLPGCNCALPCRGCAGNQCVCESARVNGICSHFLAVLIHRESRASIGKQVIGKPCSTEEEIYEARRLTALDGVERIEWAF